jgi:hypothetical protein
MLKYGEVNPLNVFGLRRMDHCPPHFERIDFDLKVDSKNIVDWVYENLAGRFYFSDAYTTDSQGRVQMVYRIGFENAGEASIFGLMLPTINQHGSVLS